MLLIFWCNMKNEKNIVLVSNNYDVTIVKADKNMITTVISYLVAKAIKFTNDYGIVPISAKKITKMIDGQSKKFSKYLLRIMELDWWKSSDDFPVKNNFDKYM